MKTHDYNKPKHYIMVMIMHECSVYKSRKNPFYNIYNNSTLANIIEYPKKGFIKLPAKWCQGF